jgi:hypothetical protein
MLSNIHLCSSGLFRIYYYIGFDCLLCFSPSSPRPRYPWFTVGTRARGEAVNHGSSFPEEPRWFTTSTAVFTEESTLTFAGQESTPYRSIEVPFDGMTGAMAVPLASCLIGLGLGREKNIVYAFICSTLYSVLIFVYPYFIPRTRLVIPSLWLYSVHITSPLIFPSLSMSMITQVRGGRDRTHPITAGLSRAISALLVTQTRISSAWWILFAVLFLSVLVFWMSLHFLFFFYFTSFFIFWLFLFPEFYSALFLFFFFLEYSEYSIHSISLFL